MHAIKIIASVIVIFYGAVIVLLYTLQSKLIFYPGVLSPDFKFRLGMQDEEIFVKTEDGERINALFFKSERPDVILYFHGNAGDLSGWQFVSEDFTALGLNFMIIDYRGYGKSSGKISESGLYADGEAAYNLLIEKGFRPENILIYGRSIGCGIAVDVAAKNPCKGLILEAPFTSMSRLADEKLPFFFPSLFLKYRFNNLGKINRVKCPVIFLHGSADSLIPPKHSARLFDEFTGKKKMIVVEGGAHNDLHAFRQYEAFLGDDLPAFF